MTAMVRFLFFLILVLFPFVVRFFYIYVYCSLLSSMSSSIIRGSYLPNVISISACWFVSVAFRYVYGGL